MSLCDQSCISRFQRCSQDAHLWPAGKHPLSIALQRHIIIVTIVYDSRIRSTVRHIQALAPAAPDAERKRTCVPVSGKILAVSCGSPTDGSWRGTLLSNHRAEREKSCQTRSQISCVLRKADAVSSRWMISLEFQVCCVITCQTAVSNSTSNWSIVRYLPLRSQSFIPTIRPIQASTAVAAYSISRTYI